MKNLNQKREKAISCCEYIFFLNAQFLPFRFPQNIPLKENRHLRNMALVFAEKHVSFGGCNRGEKPTFLNWYLCSGFPAQSPKMGIVTTVWPIIWCKSLWVTNNLEIDFGKETPTPFSKLVVLYEKKVPFKVKVLLCRKNQLSESKLVYISGFIRTGLAKAAGHNDACLCKYWIVTSVNCLDFFGRSSLRCQEQKQWSRHVLFLLLYDITYWN